MNKISYVRIWTVCELNLRVKLDYFAVQNSVNSYKKVAKHFLKRMNELIHKLFLNMLEIRTQILIER